MMEKKKYKKGTVIFYSIYGAGIVIFFMVLAALMTPLRDWLTRYEESQPHHKSQEIFAQIFEGRDWEQLYTEAGLQDTRFEDEETFAAYMESLIGDGELVCLETSAGLSGDKKFVVRCDDRKIATFLLTGGGMEGNQVKPWVLKSMEVFVPRTASVTVQRLPGQTVYINGVALDDSDTIHRTTTLADAYLPEGEQGFCLELQQVTGLWQMPTVEVQDADGNKAALIYDEESKLYIQSMSLPAITDSHKKLAENAARAYCRYMINAKDHQLDRYFDTDSKTYQEIIRFEQWTVQSYQSYQFPETVFEDFYAYSDDCFSVVVELTLDVKRNNGTIKSYPLRSTLVFTRNSAGDFLATAMTNVDIQEKQEQVRLVFVQEQTQVIQWVNPADPKITLPSVTVPEGKTFKGWVTQSENEEGKVTLTVVFNEQGQLLMDEGKTLVPMELTPLFE